MNRPIAAIGAIVAVVFLIGALSAFKQKRTALNGLGVLVAVAGTFTAVKKLG
jgi:hypothetical protein